MLELYENLQQRYELGEITVQRFDLVFFTVPRQHLASLLLHLRDSENFTHLVLLTAVDWIEQNQFQLTYLINNRDQAVDLGLRVMIPRDDPSMESIHELWPTAATYQRELKEMFGIDFPGSPGVDEDFILEGWTDIPPYRRDFDTLKYSKEHYIDRPGRVTLDPEEHMKQLLYPDPDAGGKD
jgi:NADH-quinone oxidoreductase subunit C